MESVLNLVVLVLVLVLLVKYLPVVLRNLIEFFLNNN